VALVNPQQFPGEAIVAEENRDKVRRMLGREEVQHLIPNDMEFVWSAKSRIVSEGKHYYTLYPVKKQAERPAVLCECAQPRSELQPAGRNVEMNSQGKGLARITGANINKRIAIILDNSIFPLRLSARKSPGIPRLRGWKPR
jgi:preprotein translocase subunit SecD